MSSRSSKHDRDVAARAWAAPDTLTGLVAFLSAFAGLAHLVVAPEHMVEWWGFGTFFYAVGIGQLGFAAIVVSRLTPRWALAGIVGTVAVVLTYIVSRTTGVPVGPEDSVHRLERAGAFDLAVTTAELVVIGALVTWLPDRMGRITVDLLLSGGVALWFLRLAGVLG